MSLEKELANVRKDVITDGYDMSIGEVVSLYKDSELVINPEYQRYFRWDEGRKTKFIESILLGIPIPPIFVFQKDDGAWELVDGLQRVSTLLQFMGLLQKADKSIFPPLILGSTRLLPSLEGHTWDKLATPGSHPLTVAQKLDIKRARLRVEILKRESDPTSKFELFQRLNTGGAALSPQEVRNCTMVMMDASFFQWLIGLSRYEPFTSAICITDSAEEKQFASELVLRVLAARSKPYVKGFDVHEYLDDVALTLASDQRYDRDESTAAFKETFDIIYEALGDDAFKRWDGKKFAGKFLLSVFEVIAVGVSQNLKSLQRLTPPKRKDFVRECAKNLATNPTFAKYSGAGVRGTDRMANLLPLAKKLLSKP